jgi:hypothetical protein
VAEIDGAYFGGHVRPENRAADRLDRRLAENRSVGGGPAQAQEHILDPAVRHAHDLGGAERACRRG